MSLLFATLAGRPISVAVKGLKTIVSTDQRTVVSEEKNKKSELERAGRDEMRLFPTRSESSIEAQ